MMIPFRSKIAAFTLTEILIAMMIMSVVFLSAMQLFNAVQINMEVAEKQAKRLREVQLAVRQLEDDIRHLVFRERRNEYGDKVALLRGDNGGVNTALEFTRANWRNPAKLARSNLQHLLYEFGDEELIRSHWLYVDNAQENQQIRRSVLSGVEALKFEFLKEDDWQQEWQTEQDNLLDLPRAIKVTMELKDLGEIYRIFPIASFEAASEQNKAPVGGG